MLWLTWQMWILLMLAFAGGVITGWTLRAKSDELPETETETEVSELEAPQTVAPASAAGGSGVAAAELVEQQAPASPEPEPESEPEGEPEPINEPAMSVAEDEGSSAQERSPQPASARTVTDIKGLGPKAAERLADAGVTELSQIASWTQADIDKFDELTKARGRIERDDWVGQARKLTDS